jgi:hypothetical protein
MDAWASTPIDLYCERQSPAFWAEPLNAFSNLSFLLAALAFWVLVRRRGARPDVAACFLLINLVLVGAGSFVFHTYATRLALLADLLPIFVYQLAFLLIYARQLAGVRARGLSLLALAFVVVNLGFALLPRAWLNGSLAYAGALLFLGLLAAWHHRSGQRGPRLLWWAFALLGLALACRSLDAAVCGLWPLGTHWLWHVLDAVVLYLTARAYWLNRPAAA